MIDFNKIAVVNLVEDYYKRDYYFALYDTEEVKKGSMVVVNAGSKESRKVGIVKSIISKNEYNKNVTAQVVGVVNIDGFLVRQAEENKIKEIEKKKKELKKKLKTEIEKENSIEYYDLIAKRFSNNPIISELALELENLERQ